jgi:hypothetical protein
MKKTHRRKIRRFNPRRQRARWSDAVGLSCRSVTIYVNEDGSLSRAWMPTTVFSQTVGQIHNWLTRDVYTEP